jgi:hypothetical protein
MTDIRRPASPRLRESGYTRGSGYKASFSLIGESALVLKGVPDALANQAPASRNAWRWHRCLILKAFYAAWWSLSSGGTEIVLCYLLSAHASQDLLVPRHTFADYSPLSPTVYHCLSMAALPINVGAS